LAGCRQGTGELPLEQIKERLALDLPESALRAHVERLISLSYDNGKTWAYDRFQKLSNGIAE
jgi:hypothetical protein